MAESDAISMWHLGWQSGTRKESSPRTTAFPCQYYSTNDPHSFNPSSIHSSTTDTISFSVDSTVKNYTTREATYTEM